MEMRRRAIRSVQVFTNKYPLLGPIFWLLSVQYYIVQFVVAAAYKTSYNWLGNAISDLGNTVCGPYNGRDVCSPLFPLMNSSFIVLGVTMALGSLLIYEAFPRGRLAELSFKGMGLAGIGTILVGIFPENTVGQLHLLGAALPFVIGNLALIGLGLSLRLPLWFAFVSVLFGIGSLFALLLLLNGQYLGLGFGGMERIVAYPQTIWLMLFGLYTWRNRYAREPRTSPAEPIRRSRTGR